MKLYGIGVGPGDPELLTLRAYRILKEVDLIVAPRSRVGRKSRALLIVEQYIKERAANRRPTIVEPVFPMTRNRAELELYWHKAKDAVLKSMDDMRADGKECETFAFITLGDPSLYSTFYRFLDIFRDYVDEVEVIPGVTSFSACSATARIPVVEGYEVVSVVPEVNDRTIELIDRSDSVILLKPKNMERIKERIGDREALMCVKIGFNDQELVMGNLNEIEVPDPYLVTLIIKKGVRNRV